MVRPALLTGLTFCLLPMYSWAAAPNVVADIAPLHSIVAQVMSGVGHPDLLVQSGASPHSYSLRPSEAEALSQAEVVFWISEDLTPWLENPLENLASSAHKVEMLDLSATIGHPFREGATFESHAHGDEDGHNEEHEEHNDGHEEHHHGEYDPHAWLDPMNAKVWAGEIAQVLSSTDPSNAEIYQKNAQAFQGSLEELTGSLSERADRLSGIRFIVFHDAYQYFERRFDLPAAGAIALSDASDPSPARIREIQALVSELGVTCAFTEPQYNPGLIDTVFEGSSVNTIGVMDPLGADIKVGTDHYTEMLKRLMASLEQCRPQP
ncbi:zinc ABC transporter substrate-binding protein [Marinobacter salexigens]|uniref:High-affinity zinc uptake system protein ZnuA n=1 Tax=Marinobacter salexigens TaxID=1925763 RepID=A0ABS6A8X7_9GAMM|nr:zinc ABC transporter substrate-binding protein [Marinobacter salexigens]MBU2874558.1 zinc ABC transporter substrate-binding protein [Marinobacter salexigens]